MPEPLRNNDDILSSDRDAEYARNLQRARNLSYQKPQSPQTGQKTPGNKPSPTLGSGLSLGGKAANDTPAGAQPSGSSGIGGLGGGGSNDNQESAGGLSSLSSDVANAAINSAVPGASLSSLWTNDLPPLLRIMVAGKEFTKPGGIILLWPILSLLYCFFGVGTLFFWMLQPRKSSGQEIKLADIKMGPIDTMILGLSLGVWGLISLFFFAIFGAITTASSIIPGT